MPHERAGKCLMERTRITKPTLGVGVLQWNASQYTISLLDDLGALPKAIVVCDNGSKEVHYRAVSAFLEKKCSSVSVANSHDNDWGVALIRNKNNSGFSSGMNLCIDALIQRKTDWVWLLNNDTRVCSQSLALLHKYIETLNPGVYGTQIQQIGSGEVSYGNRFNRFTTRHKPIEEFSADYKSLGEWYIDGASFLIHREVIEKVGMLDEEFFLYFEELDYKHRATKHGYDQKLLPKVVVQHVQGGTSSENRHAKLIIYHETYSTLSFYNKHYTYYLPVILLARTPLRLLSLILKRRFKELIPVLKATADFISGDKTMFSAPEVISMDYFYTYVAK